MKEEKKGREGRDRQNNHHYPILIDCTNTIHNNKSLFEHIF